MIRKLSISVAACVVALTLSACGADEAPEPEATTTLPTTEMVDGADATEARLEDGVQVAEITVGPMGYEPNSVRLQAGIPARLVFTRTIEGECPSQVQVPDLNVPLTDLPMNEPTAITFTPDSTGSFQFICGMDMLTGTLVVRS